MATLMSVLIACHPQGVVAQTLTPPEAQATVDAARAEVNRTSVQATSVSRLATANAPTATALPTITPMPPSSTPAPTATATGTPTPAPTSTYVPSATPDSTATPAPAAAATDDGIAQRRLAVFGVMLLCIGLLAGVLWAMRDRTFFIKRDGDRS